MPIFTVSTPLDSEAREPGDAGELEFDKYAYGSGLGVRGVVIASEGGCAFDSVLAGEAENSVLRLTNRMDCSDRQDLTDEIDFMACRATPRWIWRRRGRADERRRCRVGISPVWPSPR